MMTAVLHWSARGQKCRLDEGLYLSASRFNSANCGLDIPCGSWPPMLSLLPAIQLRGRLWWVDGVGGHRLSLYPEGRIQVNQI